MINHELAVALTAPLRPIKGTTEECLNNGTYMLDTVINGDAIESKNKIIAITVRNYNIIE